MNREVPAGEITQLLLRWRAGDEAALTSPIPVVYEELRAMARRHLRQERGSHTLQRMVDQTQVDRQSRSQFGIASQVMKRIVADYARRRSAAKRGGRAQRVDLELVLAKEDAEDNAGYAAGTAGRGALAGAIKATVSFFGAEFRAGVATRQRRGLPDALRRRSAHEFARN